MRALIKSLLAELFPGWVKDEIIQHPSRVGSRSHIAAQQRAADRRPTFGKRHGYRAGSQQKGRRAGGPGAQV